MAQPKRLTISPKAPRARKRAVTVQGQPPVTLSKRDIPTRGHDPNTGVALFGKKSIRRVQKVDEAKGLSMPEMTPITANPGVITGNNRPTEMVKDPMTAPNRGSKVIRPPRAGQGKLKRFNQVGPVDQRG